MIFRYPGGKSKKSIGQRIISFFPKFSEFRVPFVGGGGVYFDINPCIVKNRWINDINSGLIAVYKALNERPIEFIKLCCQIDPDSDLRAKFNELVRDNRDEALRYFFINRTVWGGRVNYNIPSRLYFSNPQGWKIVRTDKLLKASQHIQGTKIDCGDYLPLLVADGDDVLIYADPPYVSNTEMSPASQQYQHNFTIQDHKDLAYHISLCKHKVCLSYDDHELIRNLYKDFNINTTSWAYCGSSMSKKKLGHELIITNY